MDGNGKPMDGNGKPIDGSDGLCCAATVTGNAVNRTTDARIRIVHRLATGIARGDAPLLCLNCRGFVSLYRFHLGG